MLACNCLNVIIEIGSNDFLKVNTDSLHLNEEEAKDTFFKQDVVQIGSPTKISKAHEELVDIRNTSSWVIHQCLNCNVNTHAISREKGNDLVLVCSKLLVASEIAALRTSGLYSNVFNIVVNTNMEEERIYDYLSADAELMIGSLKKQTSKWINKQVSATEERIRQYTEQQYAALEEFREKALREQKALSRVILNRKMLNSPKNRVKMVPLPIVIASHTSSFVPDETSVNNRPVLQKTPTKTIVNTGFVQMTPDNVSAHRPVASDRNSFDAEGLFPFEDIDHSDSFSNCNDDDISDAEEKDRDDGIQIKQRMNDQQISLAKSLPMNIPVFNSPFHTRDSEDQDDMLPNPEDPMDIAASIKALAKSVHGNPVFGELPRPRCRTNI